MEKLSDSKQLDWTAAKAAADRISEICRDAWFAAPEALATHHRNVKLVVEQMNILAQALLITSKDG